MKNNVAALRQLKENSTWYLLLGISLVALGILAIAYSYITSTIAVIYLGSLLFIQGIFQGIKSFTVSKWSYFFLNLFLSILYIAAGLFLMIDPVPNAISLTLLLAIFFVISGIAKIVFALTQKVMHQGLLIFNGIITILLGSIIWYQWPVSGLWVIGAFVGIDMIFTGWSWIAFSILAKNITIEKQ